MSPLKKGKGNQKRCVSSSLQQAIEARRVSSPAHRLRRKGMRKRLGEFVVPWLGFPEDAGVCVCNLHTQPWPHSLLAPQHPLQKAGSE